MRFLPAYRAAMLASVVASVALGLIQSLFYTPLQVLGGMASALAISASLGPFVVMGAARFFKVYVAPTFLRCPDSWGRYHDLKWAHISEAERTCFLGAPLLKIRAAGAPVIWLPLFFHDSRLFEATLLENAGPSHPLTVALR